MNIMRCLDRILLQSCIARAPKHLIRNVRPAKIHEEIIQRAVNRFYLDPVSTSGFPSLASQRHYHTSAWLHAKINRTDVMESIVDEVITTIPASSEPHSEWDKVGETMKLKMRANKQWPTVMMKVISGSSNKYDEEIIFQVANSLYNYVCNSEGKELLPVPIKKQPSTVLIISFMKICGDRLARSGYRDLNLENTIRQLYDDVRSITDVFDTMTSKDMIEALSSTNKSWKLSLPILEDEKLIGRPGPFHYCPIVTAALRNGDSNLAWKLLEEMALISYEEGGHLSPDDSFYMNLFRESKNSNATMDTLLEFMHIHRWIPSEISAYGFMEYFKGAGWQAKITRIGKNGVCRCCNTQLPSENLTSQTFDKLRDAFLEKCIQREDIFLNTTPNELHRFHKFLNQYQQFDFVLDGLNIALNTGTKNMQKSSFQLLKLAQMLSKKGRLLVCGRAHMKRWPRSNMKMLEDIATVFYAEDMSSDDPFMIYAALHSGMNAKIVTRDQLRDHRFLLPHDLREPFKTWQRTHQINLSSDYKQDLIWPTNLDTRVYLQQETIHIPFEDKEERASHQLPNSWICVTRN